ncbi:hypothetical protein TNCV_704951 [Trichonephila clavipes]|nr:hypothetical protein TNCV_704951 [Trichonephila clavipes]
MILTDARLPSSDWAERNVDINHTPAHPKTANGGTDALTSSLSAHEISERSSRHVLHQETVVTPHHPAGASIIPSLLAIHR